MQKTTWTLFPRVWVWKMEIPVPHSWELFRKTPVVKQLVYLFRPMTKVHSSETADDSWSAISMGGLKGKSTGFPWGFPCFLHVFPWVFLCKIRWIFISPSIQRVSPCCTLRMALCPVIFPASPGRRWRMPWNFWVWALLARDAKSRENGAFQQQSCWINTVDISWRNWELKLLKFMTFYDYRNIICMKVLSDMGWRFQWGHTDTFECQAGHAARFSFQKSGICNLSMAIQWPFNVTKSLNPRENWSFTGWKWGVTKFSTHVRCVCFRGRHRILGSGGMFWCQDANLYF